MLLYVRTARPQPTQTNRFRPPMGPHGRLGFRHTRCTGRGGGAAGVGTVVLPQGRRAAKGGGAGERPAERPVGGGER